ncbi:MAG: zinc protease, partial [Planctomycetota bacterium]
QRLHNESAEPRQLGAMAFRRMVYGDHWLGRPAYGSIESVERIQPKDLRAYHRKNWVASRCIIGVCGDLDPKEVRDFLDRKLAKWKPGKQLPPRTPQFPAPKQAVQVIRAARKQVHLYLGHLGIRRSDPDYAALVVLDHVLGQGPGFTDRISRRLRDELGLAYSVSAGMTSSAGLTPGTFTAYIGTSPEHVTTALHHFLYELHRIQDDLVPEEELRVAKDYLIGSFSIGFERASRRANYLVSSEVHGHPEDHIRRMLIEFDQVTPEQIRAAARKHLHPDHCCVSAAGPVRLTELKKAMSASFRP